MSRIHEGLETKDFVQPDGITNTTVCSKSGLVPLDGICDNDPRGSMLTTEYFDTDTVPADNCDHHVALEICADSGAIAGPYCPNKTSKVFITMMLLKESRSFLFMLLEMTFFLRKIEPSFLILSFPSFR